MFTIEKRFRRRCFFVDIAKLLTAILKITCEGIPEKRGPGPWEDPRPYEDTEPYKDPGPYEDTGPFKDRGH